MKQRVGAGLAVVWLSAAPAAGQPGASGGEWRSYAGDLQGTRYASLDEITADNFHTLERAWRWRSVDAHLPVDDGAGVAMAPAATVFDRLEAADPDRWVTRPSIARLSATPVMADGRLYLATPLYQAAAVDARTGETVWVYNPRVYEQGSPPLPAPWNHRGVAYWEAGGEARVIWGTGDGRLTAVDAATGLPAADFGADGRVSLEAGLPRARDNPEPAAAAVPLAAPRGG